MYITIICILLILIAEINSDSNTATIYTEREFKGEKTQIDATDCVSPLPDGFNDSISAINTEGHCVNLYKDEGCVGDYIIIKPGNPVHGYLEFWGFDNQVSSIGPCEAECSPRNIETRLENLSTIITVYDHRHYKGYHMDMDVKGCVQLPRKLKKRVSSIQTNETVCIEFHEHWNCEGGAIQLRKGSPFHYDLRYWGLNDGASSISLCGYRCNRQEEQIGVNSTRNFTLPGPNTVTLYDEHYFNGNAKNLDLSKGCFNISDEWEGESSSLQTYGQCIAVYERFGCSQTDNNLILDSSNTNVHSNLKLRDFDGIIRSIELCPSNDTAQTSEMKSSTEDGTGAFQIVAFTILVLFLVGLAIAAVIIIRFKLNRRRVVEMLTLKEIDEFRHGCDNTMMECDTNDLIIHTQPYDLNYEIPRDFLNIDLKCSLGGGVYAEVYKGRAKRQTEVRVVAVKMVQPYAGVEYVRALLKDIKTMIYVGKHPSIVELIGCFTQNLQNAELFVMTELCVNGCLEKFLQRNRDSFVNLVDKGQIASNILLKGKYVNKIDRISSSHFNTVHLLQWSLQIVEGMEFLALKKVIHGNPGTRNVLLDADFNLKISDFGISRQLYEHTQCLTKKQAPISWRWLAIELLKSTTFSTESDVWSFGVTIWEIFSLGDVPYQEMAWGEDFLTSLIDGNRLSKPNFATSDCYNLMLSCWREHPAERMSFPELRIKFQIMSDYYSNMITT